MFYVQKRKSVKTGKEYIGLFVISAIVSPVCPLIVRSPRVGARFWGGSGSVLV